MEVRIIRWPNGQPRAAIKNVGSPEEWDKISEYTQTCELYETPEEFLLEEDLRAKHRTLYAMIDQCSHLSDEISKNLGDRYARVTELLIDAMTKLGYNR